MALGGPERLPGTRGRRQAWQVRATLAPCLDMQQDPSDHEDRTHTRQRWSRMMKGRVSLGTLELLHQP